MGRDGTNKGAERIKQLADNSKYFRERLKAMGFIVYGNVCPPSKPQQNNRHTRGITK